MRLKNIAAGIIALVCLTTTTLAAVPENSSYIYSADFYAVASPQAFALEDVINGEGLGISTFKNPSDIFVSKNGTIYLVDAGNNRIVEINDEYKLVRTVDSFIYNGKEDSFSAPSGIFVTEDGILYIADTGNNRVVRLNKSNECDLMITRPHSELLQKEYIFLPSKIVTDIAGRIFIVSDNQPQGVMEFSPDGYFKGFIGANKVTFDFSDYFWKSIATKEQRSQMRLFLPTEYNNITLDNEGFLFVTSDKIDLSSIFSVRGFVPDDFLERIAPVRRINLAGSDILRRDGWGVPIGDYALTYTKGIVDGPSRIVDSAIDICGIYSILDRARGRIFTYDSNGYLLYIFGGLGREDGKFRSPSSFAYHGDRLLVADYSKNNITVLKLTEYGKLIREAYIAYSEGDYDKNEVMWRKVLNYNSNCDIAYIGIGKSYMRKMDYKSAMKYFKLGENRDLYSDAFIKWRNEIVRKYFAAGFWLLFGLIILATLIKYIRMYFHWVKTVDAYGLKFRRDMLRKEVNR